MLRNKDKVKVLTEMLKLVREGRWIKSDFSRKTEKGMCYCLIGMAGASVNRTVGEAIGSGTARAVANEASIAEALAANIPKGIVNTMYRGDTAVVAFNDNAETEEADVIALIKNTIRSLKAA